MKVQIEKCNEQCIQYFSHSERLDTTVFGDLDRRDSIVLSKDEQYAVLNRGSALYVAVKVISLDDSLLLAEFVDCYFYPDYDEPMVWSISCDWSYMCYGFCKLILWAPEKDIEFGGYSSGTIHRFYFDRNLYERKKKEIQEELNE